MSKQPKSVDELMKDLNKTPMGEVVSLGVSQQEYERIPFTIPEMNRITYGGIPIGRIVEFYGKESGGKTTTALDLIKNAQQKYPEKKVLFVDVEMTFDPVWATKMGVDVESLFIFVPVDHSAGQILEIVQDFIETGEFSLIVIDSLAAMVSDAEQEKSIEDSTYAGISKELSRFVRKATRTCASTATTLVGINQMRDDMSGYNMDKTPGGRAWKYHCSVRLSFTVDKHIKQDGTDATNQTEDPAGVRIKARLTKSKCFPSDRRIGYYTLLFVTGLDVVSDLIEAAVNVGVIEKGGSWYNYQQSKWQGKFKAKEALENDEALRETIFAAVNELLIGS